jgi:hypothetical protein
MTRPPGRGPCPANDGVECPRPSGRSAFGWIVGYAGIFEGPVTPREGAGTLLGACQWVNPVDGIDARPQHESYEQKPSLAASRRRRVLTFISIAPTQGSFWLVHWDLALPATMMEAGVLGLEKRGRGRHGMECKGPEEGERALGPREGEQPARARGVST